MNTLKLFGLLLFGGSLSSYGSEFSIKIHPACINKAMQTALEAVYLNAFKIVYARDLSPNLEDKIAKIFAEYMQKLEKCRDMTLVTAHQESDIVGWALFLKDGTSTVLEILCIDPRV
jgi:hypothetical protein